MSEARDLLAEAMEVFGQDGKLVMFKDPHDPFGLATDWGVLATEAGLVDPEPTLSEKVAHANARSRGELL
ncbi:hypothetical protein SEA_ANDRIS_50 [Streptomyces phage Andris]|nr:hypothetical protein SEA_ANDRIS_50 [Streptomyces phage Andris]